MKRIATYTTCMLTIALLLLLASSLFAQDRTDRSIEEFINPDGSFDLDAARLSGYEGSLDMEGFESAIDPVTGRPLFKMTGMNAAEDHPDDIYWDNSISPLIADVDGNIFAVTVYEGNLVVGGDFYVAGGVAANKIASWDGISWSPLGSGISESYVRALIVYDGQLIAGGWFWGAGGVVANNIASWDGISWSPLGSGTSDDVNDQVTALTVYDGQLIAGGHFTTASGVEANNIAFWDGSAWSPLGSGINDLVWALTAYDGNLIAGGRFSMAGGINASNISSWNGSAWSPLGSGMNGTVRVLTVYDGAVSITMRQILLPVRLQSFPHLAC